MKKLLALIISLCLLVSVSPGLAAYPKPMPFNLLQADGSPAANGMVPTYNSMYKKWFAASGSGGGTWGSITGTLSDQTDLQNAIDAKGPAVVQQSYTSADPWTPTPAVGTAGATIYFYCDSVDHALTFGTPTGTPVNGQVLIITLLSDASARALDFTTCTAFQPVGVVLPTTTVASKITSVACRYHSGRGKWLVYGVSQE